MTDALNVSELARVVADTWLNDDVELVLRQLRHWTALGLLKPSGGTFTGPGKHRRYGLEAVHRASILVRLAAMGLSVGALKALSDTLEKHIGDRGDLDGRRRWEAAVDGAETVHLGFRFIRQTGSENVEQGIVFLKTANAQMNEPAIWALPTIWLDLTDLFDRVKRRLDALPADQRKRA